MTELRRISTPFSYSLAVEAGDYIFLGLHTGRGDTFSAQLDEVMQAAAATLAHFNLSLDDLVKIQVWLKNIADLPVMEEQIRRYFRPDCYPARMTATTQFIDAERLVMIEGVAYRRARG